MKIILLTTFLFTAFFCSAASILSSPQADTSAPEKTYDLSKEAFLQQYGRDDSSKALINFFCRKRTRGQSIAGGGAIVTALATLGVVAASNKLDGDINSLDEGIGDILLVFFAIVALAGGVALMSVGVSFWSRYSRKRLLRLLDNYFDGKGIARGIARNKVFRGFVEYGEWTFEVKQQLKSEDRERAIEKRRRILERRKAVHGG